MHFRTFMMLKGQKAHELTQETVQKTTRTVKKKMNIHDPRYYSITIISAFVCLAVLFE